MFESAQSADTELLERTESNLLDRCFKILRDASKQNLLEKWFWCGRMTIPPVGLICQYATIWRKSILEWLEVLVNVVRVGLFLHVKYQILARLSFIPLYH